MGSGNPLKKNVLKSATRAVRKAAGQVNREYKRTMDDKFGLDQNNWYVRLTSGEPIGAEDTKEEMESDAERQEKKYEAQAKERADSASRREKAEAFAEMASTKGAPVKGKKYLGSQGVLGEEENSKRKRLGG